MTNWWWIRHGPTHAKGMVGWSDLPADLSDEAALVRLSKHLPSDALVVSSDLSRSVATADKITGGRERLGHVTDLREIHFGDWEGKSAGEISKEQPELSRQYWSEPGTIKPPGGESWDEMSARVSATVAGMNAKYAGRDIIAVAHFGVILSQIQAASRITARSVLSFKIDNLSVTRLEFLDPSWRVHGVNHLP